MLLELQKAKNNVASGSEVKNLKLLQAQQAASTPLKERRHAEFFEVINSSLRINSPEDFIAWAKSDLQQILPHEVLICGLGLLHSQGTQIHQLLSYNLPSEYLQTLYQNGGIDSSPVFSQWVKTRRPVLFDATRGTHSKWLENFELHGLTNMAAYGQCDLNNSTTSYFCFSKIPDSLTSRHAYLLEMLVPHLHVALIRAYSNSDKESLNNKSIPSVLSGRELEILKLLSTGKTNWEIAQILNLSENTIKSHMRRIFTKLKVNTRAQAVSLIPELI